LTNTTLKRIDDYQTPALDKKDIDLPLSSDQIIMG